MENKKKRTSLITKALMSFPPTFIVGVYIKQDFFEHSNMKATQILVWLSIVLIWIGIEATSDKYED